MAKFTQAERVTALQDIATITGNLMYAGLLLANAGAANEALTLRELLKAKSDIDALITQIAADTRD